MAIWYQSEVNQWIIGCLSNIGHKRSLAYTNNEHGGLPDNVNVWYIYRTYPGWKIAKPNTIVVTITSSCK